MLTDNHELDSKAYQLLPAFKILNFKENFQETFFFTENDQP